jgi:ubiquinone biosynthesis protein Coq4
MLVLGFYAAQVSPAATFLALIAKNLVKVALERSDRHDEHLAALMRGWELGRRTKLLFAADWRRLAERPLGEVRARFGISRADAEESTRLTATSLASAEDEAAGVDRDGCLEVFRRIVLLPYGDAGFANGQELRRCLVTPARGGRFAARLLADPDVRSRVTRFPRLGRLDFRALHELPAGSVGRAYADHMLVKGFDPPPAIPDDEKDLSRFFAGHIIETHDVWHAVTGAGTDKRGECCLHAFYSGQLHPLPVQLAYVARCILKTALFDLDRADLHMDAIARGWRVGRSSRPLALVDWHELFPMSLAEVRARFEIPQGGVEDALLH